VDGGPAGTVLATAGSSLTGGGTPYQLATDGTNVYVTYTALYGPSNPNSGSIVAIPVACGGSPSTFVPNLIDPQYIAASAEGVAWTDYANSTNSLLGAVFAMVNGKLVTLWTGSSGPTGIAVEGGNVYWMGWTNVSGTQTTGVIMTAPITGSSPATPLASSTDIGPVLTPTPLAADSQYVYYQNWPEVQVFSDTENESEAIERVPVGGGKPETLVAVPAASDTTNSYINSFAIDATNIYWVETDTVLSDDAGVTEYVTTQSVYKAPLSTGAPAVPLLSNFTGSVETIAVDATNAYLTSGYNVVTIPLGGGAKPTLVASMPGLFPQGALALAGGRVFTVDMDEGDSFGDVCGANQ
jgi:hypothetical protein